MRGILYVVATPIGNLKDITLRATDVLNEVDFIVAENKTYSLKLLNHFNIKKRIIGINSYTEKKKAKEIVEYLKRGESCALITNAGTPCISDPGTILVKTCYESGIEVKTVPGPSALVSALSISGLFVDKFLFYGFLPQKRGKKIKIFKGLSMLPYPIVFFESPRRVLDTLECIKDGFGERFVVVFKEMTKIYEGIKRGYITEVIEYFKAQDIKGEYVIIVDREQSD
ncbi:MAG TPA: 16S rRNA (cytidine(1402)-2'-O)-methyltransferase [Syntrophorhabdaceae bacterium]|nr:16S rRNA (cytidine(1402)-2'-O)-methyltransferase [Syntrophorhabdaceae bacterium]